MSILLKHLIMLLYIYLIKLFLCLVTGLVGLGYIIIEDVTTSTPIKHIQTEENRDFSCLQKKSTFEYIRPGYIRDVTTGRFLVFDDSGILVLLQIPQLGFNSRAHESLVLKSELLYMDRGIFRLCNDRYICYMCVCENLRPVTLVLDRFVLPCVVSHSGLWKGQQIKRQTKNIT